MPPEQLDGNLSFKVDIWSFGCLLLEFCSGIKPFNQIENDIALSMAIFKGKSPLEYALDSSDAPEFDLVKENKEFKNLLELCFEQDYKKRPSSDELFSHPFFIGYIVEWDWN